MGLFEIREPIVKIEFWHGGLFEGGINRGEGAKTTNCGVQQTLEYCIQYGTEPPENLKYKRKESL